VELAAIVGWNVPFKIHGVVQNAANADQIGLDDPIQQEMSGSDSR